MSHEVGQDRSRAEGANGTEPMPEDRLVETEHRLALAGETISYRVTAGTIVLKEEGLDEEKATGEVAKAAIFFVAYTRSDASDLSQRPITFAFNGGPGSSSVWLHLGLLGPRRVCLEKEGEAPPPPYRLVDNAHTLLDASDLVFIDPVSTGFSRAVPGEKPKHFHDFKQDIEWVGEFIRLYTTRFKRWSSPKYLIGESYGTTRAAALAGHLQERHGLYLNGLMLVSSVLNFQTLRFVTGNDLPFILFLPSYTAAAWYHGRLNERLQADLRATLTEVEGFALGEYASALMLGDNLPSERQHALARQLAEYTGLTESYMVRTNLRINIYRFVKELLRGQSRTVGRLDSRYTGIDRDAAGELSEFDPSYAVILGPYSATLNDYVRTELGFESDLPYEILTDRVHPWKFDQHHNQYVNVAETLRQAMSVNPHLRVYVANGYYDLATPYLATHYTFSHMALDPVLRANVTMDHFEAGHMMYVQEQSLSKLKEALAEFVATV